ncbi:MAG: HPr kinase/phosphorylase [Ignavibacteriota bacterium]|jgi:HPr kinase/phosphorylase|nr:MAG: HPr kinase/phosphorylase [Chlorobiota bacterium]MBE7478009.1 HPr kinase/phosphorylase [Ignavibacteriales bacterium]MBL1123460.1 HPr kinase/phosphorylase [Ignavibacteriota bacterium]MBV6421760.1 HPr kinase/phosphorylase [Ignavibacteriaceae bacterium]MCE7856593.1 HPr kinase/phosphorylase [Ignavibacteria bacterium CHB3]MEB2296163.1 HPr(Ser) kinase/phosphatase [Ignavibacteria bacterium]
MTIVTDKSISRKESITVDFFYSNARKIGKLELLSENPDLERKISDQNVHRPGLALAGFVDLFTYNRVQIFGNTEVRYLNKLSTEEQEKALGTIFQFNIPCIILTNNNKPIPVLLDFAKKKGVAVFSTPFPTTKLVYLISDFLDDQFSERITIHGSFVDVYGVGICFVGKSGVGKSEVALDLIERGHRLVADDVIILTKKGENILIGSGTDLAKHYMEIRGLGIIDVERIFGIRAIRYQKRLEILVELEVWDDKAHYTRTGLEEKTLNIGDIEILHIKLPILPGKNITVISEVIALNYLLKHYGYDAAEMFKRRLSERISNKSLKTQRSTDYFEHDFE